MAGPYVIGIDFGTLSARAVLVDARNGKELAAVEHEYASGVIEHRLAGGARLKGHSALQDPGDYLTTLEKTVPFLLKRAKVRPEKIGAIGTDFTSCTVLPVKSDGTPLCFDQRFRKNPHAWVKLWKHHATQPEADFINRVGTERGEEFIRAYGGKYSSEWFFSKVLETVRQAPEVYKAADFFIEAGDWIVWQLCGKQTRNVSAAGFKGMRVHRAGKEWTYPAEDFFAALHPRLRNVIREKVGGTVLQLGAPAGALTESMAKRLRLKVGIPVAAGNIDAHAGVPACGVTKPGTLVMIMGTSTCHLLMTDRKVEAEGICGVVRDGIVPGFWGYEAGQSGVGDLFAWFTEQACPGYVCARGKSMHECLARAAAQLQPGQSGLLAMDWWNGNRSVLVNADLTGMILGLTIHTRPHEIYRALIEATAFGTRKIAEAFQGIAIKKIVASGGLAQKNPLLMQIYADVLQRPIHVAAAEQTSAFGAGMWASVAGGIHRDIHRAAEKMVRSPGATFRPEKRHRAVYDRLYAQYTKLHDYFGRDSKGPMRELRRIQHEL